MAKENDTDSINIVSISCLNDDGEIIEALKMTKEEYAQVVSKFGTGHRVERKMVGYYETLDRAHAAASPDEELTEENFNWVNTKIFEKAVLIMKHWTEMTLNAILKNKNFRISINYNAEVQKTDFAIYTPVTDGKDGIQQESSDS